MSPTVPDTNRSAQEWSEVRQAVKGIWDVTLVQPGPHPLPGGIEGSPFDR